MTTNNLHHEDYLERILQITNRDGFATVTEIAKELDVTKSSVSQMLTRLQADKFIKKEKYRFLKLTNKGKKVAIKIRNRHLVLEEFFKLLKVPQKIRDKDIEGIEHSLSSTTLKAIKKITNQLANKT